ncbi:unnamed protein product, partial [Musa hybrid cultivar]
CVSPSSAPTPCPLLTAHLLNHHHSFTTQENCLCLSLPPPLTLTLLSSFVRALKVDDISVLVDLVVRGSKRARENVATSLLNLVKSDEDKMAGDIRKVDGAEATVRALVGNSSKVSVREKCKVEVLL